MASEQPHIRVHNSLTRRKEDFRPLRPGHVGLYACGVTVYDDCHLGHAMQAIVFDVIYRYLRHRGFEVTYVRNYTDVDDKIIARASERGISPLELSAEMIRREAHDMAGMGIAQPTHAPKVSDFIPQILAFIARLIEHGAAYATSRGNVYYRVRSKADYGKLSGRKIEELRTGVRKEVEDDKEDPLDFALWKAEDVAGAAWDSPYGRGRPGWHIECSVMSHELLGDPFDIHGGGLDLIFPHHENEVAQSESYCGHPHVNYWIHNGLLTVNKEKMSKSLGNFYTIAAALEKFGRELIRFTLLQFHYRSNPDFNAEMMAAQMSRLAGLFEHLLRLAELEQALRGAGNDPAATPLEAIDPLLAEEVRRRSEELVRAFETAMDDDFNTPAALVVLIDGLRLIDDCLRRKKTQDLHRCVAALAVWRRLQPLAEVLGVLQHDPRDFFSRIQERFLQTAGLEAAWIHERIDRRGQARDQRDYATADQMRDELLARGVELRDTPSGTDWSVARSALEQLYG